MEMNKRVSFADIIAGARARRAEKDEGGGGGNMSRGASLNIRWGARWKPPQNYTTELRLLNGGYVTFEDIPLPYYSYIEHFIAGPQKSLICSKQYKFVDGALTTTAGKCLACEERDRDSKNISWRMMHAWNGIHLAWYHLVPVMDRDTGKPMLYKRGRHAGEPIMEKQPCEGRRCSLCKEGLEKVFGRKVHWTMGNSHLEQVGGVMQEVEKNCTCGGRITEMAYECAECATVLLDIADANPEESTTFGGDRKTCPKCGHVDFPVKQLECNKCQDPTPVQIYDCNLEVKRTGEKTSSTVQIPHWEVAPLPDELKDMARPWPFKRIFAPDPFDIQAKVLRIRNPYADEEAGAHTEPYDDQTPEDDIAF